MGIDTQAFTFIGKEFRNREEGLQYFQSKVAMTEADLDEMGPKLERKIASNLLRSRGSKWRFKKL